MNILHIIASPSPGGIESFVKDIGVKCTEHGQSVHICFLETAREARTSEEFGSEYISDLEAAGVNVFFIGQSARRWPWIGIRKMRNYVSEHSIDVYHSHLTYGIVFGAFLHVPRVYTHHSIDMRVGRLVFAFVNQFIEQLVGISDKCSKTLAKHASRKVETIFNGVDVEKFSQQITSPREIEGKVNCISVGRICKEKNYELLVQAISRLPTAARSRLAVKIVGAGSGEMTASLEKEISDKGVGDVISLLGSRSDVPALLGSAQLFLMSSSSEGLPIALIEAAASGLPCVVTDAGGCREIVEGCQNGIIVELENPQAFAEAIETIISKPEKYSEYSTNALNHSTRFSIENATSLHLSMYRHLLSQFPQS